MGLPGSSLSLFHSTTPQLHPPTHTAALAWIIEPDLSQSQSVLGALPVHLYPDSSRLQWGQIFLLFFEGTKLFRTLTFVQTVFSASNKYPFLYFSQINIYMPSENKPKCNHLVRYSLTPWDCSFYPLLCSSSYLIHAPITTFNTLWKFFVCTYDAPLIWELLNRRATS